MKAANKHLLKLIKDSINEDVGTGDVTTTLLITEKQKGTATFLVKEDCVIAGIEISKLIAKSIHKKLHINFRYKDGAFIKAHTVIGTITGKVAHILMAERVMLNYMQRMSGIATKTNRYLQLIKKTNTKILDTRKTTPNFRIFEKMAVKIGGGCNHRFGLYDEILIKDNHIEANEGLKNTLEKLKSKIKFNKPKRRIVVEVKNLMEFNIASTYSFIDRILLDNMTCTQIKEIVKINKGKKLLEASGGINSKSLVECASTGVDFISIGALTHHIESIDISLNIEK